METTKIRQLIESTRALADELEALLDSDHQPEEKQAGRYDSSLTIYDPLRDTLPDADVRDSATREQKDHGILTLFATLYAINRRQGRGLFGIELRDLVHSVGYTDLRSLNRWEDYSMARDRDGFRWVTARGHTEWIAELSKEHRIQLPEDLATWAEPPVELLPPASRRRRTSLTSA